MLQIVRKKLTPDELSPPTLRYNSDCDCIQQTNDGGATWIDNPPADPRTSPGAQRPAPVTDDPRCDGAERQTQLLKRWINALLAAGSTLGAVNAIFAIIGVFVPGFGLFVELIIALVEAAEAIGFAAIDAAFTDEVYDTIKCIAYCNLSDNGQFTTEGFDAFQEDIGTEFGISVVTAVLSLYCNLVGIVGFNNASALGTETGDCTDCVCIDCFEAIYDFGTGDQFGFALGGLFEDAGTWEGTYWEGHHVDAGFNELVISRQYMDLTEFCAMDLTVSTTHGAAFEIRIYNSTATSYESMGSYGFEAGADHVTHTFVPDVPLQQTDGWLVIIGTTTNFQFMELWSAALGPG